MLESILAALPKPPILRVMVRFVHNILCLAALMGTASLFGCATRVMNVTSEPTGALVYMNDQEIGRTPLHKEFLWYGNYDAVIRKDGYQTLKTNVSVPAPWWQWIPLDLLTDLLPLRHEQAIAFTLKPALPVESAALLGRGEEMQLDLVSSEHTALRIATSRPASIGSMP